MNKVWYFILLAVWPCLSFADNASPVPAAVYEQGKHFQLITPPQPPASGAKVEVVEAFSYACPHCSEFDPILSEWKAAHGDSILFRRLPVVFKDTWVPLAKAYFVAEALNKADTLGPALFKALHGEKRKLFDENSLRDFFVEHGVTADEFSKTYNSFAIDGKVRLATQQAGKYGINGVPTMVVNGKYATSASSTSGSFVEMLKVVDYLIAKESGGAGASTAKQ